MPKIEKKKPTRARDVATRVYQGKLPMVGGAFGAVAFFFIGASALIAAPSLVQKMIWRAFGLATSVCMYRYAQSNLEARPGGVRVNNPWSRFELPWRLDTPKRVVISETIC